jgi:hypothetical protein
MISKKEPVNPWILLVNRFGTAPFLPGTADHDGHFHRGTPRKGERVDELYRSISWGKRIGDQ